MEFNASTMSILLLILFGLVSFALKFFSTKKNTSTNNTELALETIRPIILEVLNDILKYDYQVKDKESFKDYWIQFCYNKMQSSAQLSKTEKDFITVDNIKLIADPILETVWNMGKK